MVDLIETLESFVNQNNNYYSLYNFRLLDTLNLKNKSYILDLSGDSDSLKSRLFYYWINNVMKHTDDVILISAKPSDQSLIKLEIDSPPKLIVAETNLIEDIYDIIIAMPRSSYIFIDGFYSITTLIDKYRDKPYLTMGKILKHLKDKFGHKIHINSGISGFKNIPITYIFKDSINYKCLIKKIKTKKNFVGINYKPIGAYYNFEIAGENQIIYADYISKLQHSNIDLKNKRRVSH